MGNSSAPSNQGLSSILHARRLRKYFRDGFAPWLVRDDRIGFLTTRDRSSDLDQVVSTREFSQTLRRRFADDLQYEATSALADRRPQDSARTLLHDSASARVFCLMAVTLAAFILSPATTMAALIVLSTTYFLLVAAVRVGLALIAQIARHTQSREVIADNDLPTVTILAPLFREAHALPGLIQAIGRLNYPTEKLDVKLLLEESDRETLDEVTALDLKDYVDLVIVPESAPQTKPKACNYGLACARGEFVVIYDAEDEPEPNQLRDAVEIFRATDERMACVQARLNFYNPDENWLTRLFTLEYCLWFDHFLPALDWLGAPVPLGGTSNIFRTDVLAEIGGWDPYNVTEDADLGLRLARLGYSTAVISSTTYEEANCRTDNWMRQRSRWMKGFMQTWLVQQRSRGYRSFDWRTMIAVDFFVGGTAFAALINPLLWVAVAAERFTGYSPLAGLPDEIRWMNLAALIGGNFAFLALAAYAPLRRGLGRISPAALLTPIYWLMMSAAAWRAAAQLLTRPSFWEKTDHGLSTEAKARRDAALRSFALEQEGARSQIEGVPDDSKRHRP